MTTEGSRRPLDFYARQGPITDPGEYAGYLEGLPTEIPALCQVLQGILLHLHWARRYGVELSEERKREADLRHVERMLSRIREMDDRDLASARPLEKRSRQIHRPHSAPH